MTYELIFDRENAVIRVVPTVWGFPFEIRDRAATQRIRAISARADAKQWESFVSRLAETMTRCLRPDGYPAHGHDLEWIIHHWEGEVGIRPLTDKERTEKALEASQREFAYLWSEAQQEAFAAAEVAKDIRACPPN